MEKQKKLPTIKILLLLLLLVNITSVLAIPNEMTLQMNLLDSDNKPLTSNVSVDLKIYDNLTAGSTLWNKSYNTTPNNGLTTLVLDNIDLNFSQDYYLGITIGSDNESTPRTKLTSTPYAFKSNNTNYFSGYSVPTLYDYFKSFFDLIYCLKTGCTMTGDLNFSGASINNVSHVQFDTTGDGCVDEGCLEWNSEDGTLDLMMPGGSVTQQIGLENLRRVKANETITNGDVVYPCGEVANRLLICKSDNSDISTAGVFGIATEDITANQFGWVNAFGWVRNISTTGALGFCSGGSPAWLSSNGTFQCIPPSADKIKTLVGIIVSAHATNGIIDTNVQVIPRLQGLSQVNGTGLDDNHILYYNSTTGIWQNKILPETSPAGSDTEIQFNDDGVFGSSSNFVYNSTNGRFGLQTSTPRFLIDILAGDENINIGANNAMSGTILFRNNYINGDTNGITGDYVVNNNIFGGNNNIDGGLLGAINNYMFTQSSSITGGGGSNNLYGDNIDVTGTSRSFAGGANIEIINADRATLISFGSSIKGVGSRDSILGGQENEIDSSGSGSNIGRLAIFGGDRNLIDIIFAQANDGSAVISGGQLNRLTNDANFASIFGGDHNEISERGSTSVGGSYINISGSYSLGLGNDINITTNRTMGTNFELYTFMGGNMLIDTIIDNGAKLQVNGNIYGNGSMALGDNTLDGVALGGLNITTLHVDSIVYKSPEFSCSENANWCTVTIPEYRQVLYLEYNPETWDIVNVYFNDVLYTPIEFYNDVCTINEITLDVCTQILDKVDKFKAQKVAYDLYLLEQERLKEEAEELRLYILDCNNAGGSYTNNSCYKVVEVSTDYNGAVDIIQKEIITNTPYDCLKLNDALETISTTCYTQTGSGTYETIYKFKDNCGWTSDIGYTCIEIVEVSI